MWCLAFNVLENLSSVISKCAPGLFFNLKYTCDEDVRSDQSTAELSEEASPLNVLSCSERIVSSFTGKTTKTLQFFLNMSFALCLSTSLRPTDVGKVNICCALLYFDTSLLLFSLGWNKFILLWTILPDCYLMGTQWTEHDSLKLEAG